MQPQPCTQQPRIVLEDSVGKIAMTCMESQIHPQQGRTHGDTKFRGMISSLNHGGCRPSSGVGQTHSVSVVPHPSGTSGPPHTRGA